MTNPFKDLIRNVKERLFPAPSQPNRGPTPIVRAEKSLSERLSKTVLPAKARERLPVPIEAALGGHSSAAPAPRRISLDPSRKGSGARSAKSPSISLEPQAERAISLQISDILDQLPPEAVKPRESFDAGRAIFLKATELEKGMAIGKPSVALASIYQQAPEVFLNTVPADDSTPVFLPFAKVMEQFGNLKVRRDQVCEQAVPQLETPFLAVTLEDTARFGTTMKPLEASHVPPIKVETATAKTLAAAEPEPAVREVTRLVPPQSRPVISMRDLDALASTSSAAGASPARSEESQPDLPKLSVPKIPFHLPPNGTGEPASERVPASSGPPVPIPPPTPESTTIEKNAPPVVPEKPEGDSPIKSSGAESAAPPKPTPPARIPFKFKSPSDDIRPKFTLVPGVEPKKAPPTIKLGPKTDDSKIALPLQPLLQEVPAFQLHGSPMSVGEDVRIEFPFSLIEPQLASGRVMISAKAFQRAIPEAHRGLFVVDQNETPVNLPLQEILKHIPSNALRTRADQEEAVKVKEEFTTPFSIQADEDAKRFNAMAAAVEKVFAEPASALPIETEIEIDKEESRSNRDAAAAVETASTEPVSALPIETEIEIEKEDFDSSPHADDALIVSPGPNPVASSSEAAAVDPKQLVARASALPGVGACAITFADGLSLAGNIPATLGAGGICAMTPSLWRKIDTHMSDAKLGAFKAMTLHCADSSLTFFMERNICLAAVHAGGTGLSDDTQAELEAIVQQLSKTYAQPGLTDTGHQGKD